jgi:hypothetical protein
LGLGVAGFGHPSLSRPARKVTDQQKKNKENLSLWKVKKHRRKEGCFGQTEKTLHARILVIGKRNLDFKTRETHRLILLLLSVQNVNIAV